MSVEPSPGEDGGAPDAEPSESRPALPYTSIVYFHGMGTPRRYEELSRILDTLDRYVYVQDDLRNVGQLRGQLVKLEGSRYANDEPVAFIEFYRLLGTDTGTRRSAYFRLYESYWSPAAAGGVSPAQVLGWAFRRTLNPFKVLFSPWRAHLRLKRTFLNRLYFDRAKIPARHFQTLARVYRSFEGMEQRRKRPAGYFSGFLDAIREDKEAKETQAVEELVRLAKRWRRALVLSQIAVIRTAILIMAATFALATLVLGVVSLSADALGATWSWLAPLIARNDGMPSWMVLVTASTTPLGVMYGARFFRNFLSDVVFWTTTFEKDVRYQKRRDILKASEATLRHVLCDPQCERVVIVAHSLGTAIAYETLLNLGRRATAERHDERRGSTPGNAIAPLLSKLSHFITFGSPIDRIFYFFNLTSSRYHRFNKVVDDLMGGTDDPPFRIRKTRDLQWINLRDPADPVASRLFSPRGKLPNREDIIEVEVASSHVPNPVNAHVGYFDAELSAKVLFDACILNRKQVQAQKKRTDVSLGFAWVARHLSNWLAALIVASMTTGAVAYWRDDPQLAGLAQAWFFGLLIALAAIAGIGWLLDRGERLKLPT